MDVEIKSERIPAFIKKRLEREIDDYLHPKGMIVGMRKLVVEFCDVVYLLKLIDKLEEELKGKNETN